MSLKELCRSCLRSGQAMCSLVDSIVPKFDTPSNAVVELWKIFTKVLISTENSFPDKICTDCHAEMQQTYTFVLKCERSEDILKKMQNVEVEDSTTTIKSENDMYSNISQISSENIGWQERNNGPDKDYTDGGQIEVVQENFDDEYDHDSRSLHTSVLQREDDKLRIQLLDHLYSDDNVKQDEAQARQEVKQEPELDICTEKDEFDVVVSEVQPNTEVLVCLGCSFECKFMESMEKHIIDKHMEGQMCKLCNQEFGCSAVKHCSKHLQSTGERQFKCEICPKTFDGKQNLIKHSKRHTAERPFKCETCPKTFIHKYLLVRHLSCHMGERPFKCESCSKAFACKQSLMYHVKVHTGQQPFKCDSCPKTFIHKYLLMNHLRTHTGERPYKCEICPKSFRRKHHLLGHLKCHTEERPYKCEICSKSYRHKPNLGEHLKCHTKERKLKLSEIVSK